MPLLLVALGGAAATVTWLDTGNPLLSFAAFLGGMIGLYLGYCHIWWLTVGREELRRCREALEKIADDGRS